MSSAAFSLQKSDLRTLSVADLLCGAFKNRPRVNMGELQAVGDADTAVTLKTRVTERHVRPVGSKTAGGGISGQYGRVSAPAQITGASRTRSLRGGESRSP